MNADNKLSHIHLSDLLSGNKRRKGFLSVFLTILLLFMTALPLLAAPDQDTNAHDLKPVRVAVEDSNIFFIADAAGNQSSGYGFEYVQNIAAYADWDVEYLPCVSFSECLEMVRSGEADLFYDVSFTEDRTEWLLYADVPMGTEEYYLFCLSDNREVHAEDLHTYNEKRIGVTAGTIEGEELARWAEENGLSVEIVEYDSDPEKDQALEVGEIDIECEISMLADRNYSALTKIAESDFYIVANKERADLIADADHAYRKITEVNKYFIVDLEEEFFAKSVLNRSLSGDELDWIDEHEVLKVGYMNDYLPYSDTLKDGSVNGIVKDLLPQMLNDLGITEDRLRLEYTGFSTGASMYEALENGEIDIIFPVIDSIEFSIQNNMLISSDVIGLSAVLVYYGEFNEHLTETFAVAEGNLLQEYFTRKKYPDAELLVCPSIAACLKAVKSGRAGATLINSLRTSSLFSNTTYSGLNAVRMEEPFNFTFAVRKGESPLLSIINRAIAGTESGVTLNLAANYISSQQLSPFAAFVQRNKNLLMMTVIILLALFVVILIHEVNIINKARLKLAEANRAKTTFLFNMSHDIRTPMNAILGFTDMAKKNIRDPEKLADCLEKTQQAENLLLSLINSVLEMSRIESGKVELNETPGNVDFSFYDIKATMEELAKEKDIDITYEFGDIQDHYIYVDIDRANRVFINIISNAIKYSDRGGKIIARCEQIGRKNNAGLYRYTFKDNGIGMSEEFQKTVFDEFSRENNSTASGIQGSGLGMSVAKSFVELMHGTITCQSKQGEGTTFTIILPLRIQETEDLKYIDPTTKSILDVLPSEETVDFTGRRILLVEDNEMNREIAIDILEDQGLVVEEAEDGSIAVGLLKEKGPDYYDAILMDIQMPVMNGYDATRAIREMYPDSALPIIAVSANAFAEDKAASLEAGMNGHIAKPINTAELFEILGKYIRK